MWRRLPLESSLSTAKAQGVAVTMGLRLTEYWGSWGRCLVKIAQSLCSPRNSSEAITGSWAAGGTSPAE